MDQVVDSLTEVVTTWRVNIPAAAKNTGISTFSAPHVRRSIENGRINDDTIMFYLTLSQKKKIESTHGVYCARKLVCRHVLHVKD